MKENYVKDLILEVQGLNKNYENFQINNLNLKLFEGERK